MTKTKEYLILAGLLASTAGIRFLHLLNHSYYHTCVNFDSFFFHYQAKLIHCTPCDYNVPILGSGLSYPMAALGVNFGAMVLPPLLATLTALALFLMVRKMYNPEVALASVACFAVAILSFVLTAAGAVDRDCLNLFLITLGLACFHFAQTWKGALGVLVVAGLILIEWNWHGVAILAGMITVSYLLEWYQTGHPQRKQVILTLLITALVFMPLLGSQILTGFQRVLEQDASELHPITIIDLYPYALLCLPLLFAAGLIWKRMNRHDLFLVSWIGASIMMGLFTARLSIYMVPAVCVVAGIGIIYVKDTITLPLDSKRMILSVTVIMLIISGAFAWSLPSTITMSKDWQHTLEWVRDNTPEDATIVSWWDYGYWIQDIADRKPVVDNGTHPPNDLQNIAIIYVSEDDYIALQSFNELEADYIIMSKREQNFWPHLVSVSGIPSPTGNDRPNSVYQRLYGDFHSDYFEVVYKNKSVAVLKPIGA